MYTYSHTPLVGCFSLDKMTPVSPATDHRLNFTKANNKHPHACSDAIANAGAGF